MVGSRSKRREVRERRRAVSSRTNDAGCDCVYGAALLPRPGSVDLRTCTFQVRGRSHSVVLACLGSLGSLVVWERAALPRSCRQSQGPYAGTMVRLAE